MLADVAADRRRPASAATSTYQWIIAGGSHALPTTANTYHGMPFAHKNSSFVTTGEWFGSAVVPSGGTLSDFAVRLSGDIGSSGQSAAFTLMRDTTGIGTASDTIIDRKSVV